MKINLRKFIGIFQSNNSKKKYNIIINFISKIDLKYPHRFALQDGWYREAIRLIERFFQIKLAFVEHRTSEWKIALCTLQYSGKRRRFKTKIRLFPNIESRKTPLRNKFFSETSVVVMRVGFLFEPLHTALPVYGWTRPFKTSLRAASLRS